MCTKNYDQIMYGAPLVPDTEGDEQMERWTFGKRPEKVTYREVGASPKSVTYCYNQLFWVPQIKSIILSSTWV